MITHMNVVTPTYVWANKQTNTVALKLLNEEDCINSKDFNLLSLI